jgi:RHS repeat-associated protein
MNIDPYGDLIIDDLGNNTVQEVAASAGSGTESVTTPSGYTLVDSKTTGQTTTYVYTHTVGSSDTGVTLSYPNTVPKVASLAVYSGVNTTTPVDTYDDATTSSGTSVTASSLTTANPGDELVDVGGAGQQGSAATWTAPSGLANAVQVQDSGISSDIADGAGPATATSTGSATATTSVSGQLAAVFLALSPGTATTTTAYDADDEATVVTDPDGQTTLTCYDGDGNVAETVPPVGVAANSLTAASCPTSYPSDYGDRLATDATTYSYNALNERTTVTTPAPSGLTGYETTTYAYDAAGNLTSVTAPPTSTSGGAPDQVTDYTYDADNERLTTTTASGTTAAATMLECHDPNGEVVATVPGDGNATTLQTCSSSSPYTTSSSYQTTYSYDSLGDLVTTTAPATTWATSGQLTTDAYDAAGNQLTSEDPNGVTTTNTYTPLNQVATVSYSDSTHGVTDTYDADGQRTQMTDATSTSTYGYDAFGEMTSEENGASQIVDYGYDSLGDTTSVTYPLGSGAGWATSDTVYYSYDSAGEMGSVTDFNGNTVSVVNNADGLPSSLTLGATGDTISTSYDPTDSPSSITLSNGSSTLQEFSYSDEPSRAISSETDTPSSSLSPADYTYDANSRVTSLTPGSGSTDSYGFDPSNNLTTLPGGATGTNDYASELTSSVHSGTTTNYTYSADGQRTQEAVGGSTTVSATYNGAQVLTSYSDSAANMTTATYDGDGLRASETSTPSGGSSTPQSFVYDTTSATPQMLMDSTNGYVYGPDAIPLEQINLSSGTVHYLVSDALGSVRGVVNASGSLVNSTSYDAWGNPETSGGVSAQTPIGFAGGYTDPSGLVYLVHRYYDPVTGQFVSVDPLVDQTQMQYNYAGDDPVNGADPSGLLPVGTNGKTCLPLGNPNNLVCITPSVNPSACANLLQANGISNAGGICPTEPTSAGSLNLCVDLTFAILFGGTGSACLVISNSGLSVTETGGFVTGLYAGAGLTVGGSNACKPNNLGKSFSTGGGSIGPYGGSGATGNGTDVGSLSVFGFGLGFYSGRTYTWVQTSRP